jgi:phenylpropionate dioxygenase-like ring-hydroxylating dioxygenase large terminal subunit
MKNIKNLISQDIETDGKCYLKNNWFLIGVKSEFKNHNDYKTFQLFDKPVIVFNFKGSLSAFTNVCPHRGSRIKLEKKGNEVFNCVYHGWSFNSNGKFISAPYKLEAFGKKNLNIKCLEKWKLDYCKNFIFISRPENKLSLKKYLGRTYKILNDLSGNVENCIGTKEYIWNCNWKLCIENAVDEYHAPILHKNTFKKTLNLNPSYLFSKKVLGITLPLNEKYVSFFKSTKLILKNEDIKDKYYHFLFFPNTTFASTMGVFNFLQTYLPASENKTIVTTSIFLDKVCNDIKNSSMLSDLKDMALKFNEEVFMEDKVIVEDLNKNIDNNHIFSNFGKFEKRVKKFRTLL